VNAWVSTKVCRETTKKKKKMSTIVRTERGQRKKQKKELISEKSAKHSLYVNSGGQFSVKREMRRNKRKRRKKTVRSRGGNQRTESSQGLIKVKVSCIHREEKEKRPDQITAGMERAQRRAREG